MYRQHPGGAVSLAAGASAVADLATLLDMELVQLTDVDGKVGNTLLHVACQNGNLKIVKLLVRRGASLDEQNLRGDPVPPWVNCTSYTSTPVHL